MNSKMKMVIKIRGKDESEKVGGAFDERCGRHNCGRRRKQY